MDGTDELSDDKLRAILALINRIEEAIGCPPKQKRRNALKPRAATAKKRILKNDPDSEGGSNQAHAA